MLVRRWGGVLGGGGRGRGRCEEGRLSGKVREKWVGDGNLRRLENLCVCEVAWEVASKGRKME